MTTERLIILLFVLLLLLGIWKVPQQVERVVTPWYGYTR